MSTLNETKIKEELLNLIRNSDIISVSDRNQTTVTDNFTATASQTDFILDNEGVKNIRSVIVDGQTKVLYVDYDINIMFKTATESKLVNFFVGLTGGEDVDITYDYGTLGDKIYADYALDKVSISSFPRAGFELVSTASKNRSINDAIQQKNLVFDFFVLEVSGKIDTLAKSYRDIIFNNKKSLKNLNLLRPSGQSSKKLMPELKGSLGYRKHFVFTAPLEFEIEE